MQDDHFHKFLDLISPDRDEAGRGYIRMQEELVRRFEFDGVADPEGAAIVALERAVAKVGAGAVVPDVGRYCRGIARNITKEQKRKDGKEWRAALAYHENQASEFPEQVTRIYTLLKPCFDHLPREDQQLLVDYCLRMKGRERAEHRRGLAEKLDTTVLGLRMRVTRLRANLLECVKRRMRNL